MDLLIAPPEIQRHHPVGSRLDLRGLAAAYARPTGAQRWVSVNMVSTIDGAATKATATQWASYSIQSNGTGWFII